MFAQLGTVRARARAKTVFGFSSLDPAGVMVGSHRLLTRPPLPRADRKRYAHELSALASLSEGLNRNQCQGRHMRLQMTALVALVVSLQFAIDASASGQASNLTVATFSRAQMAEAEIEAQLTRQHLDAQLIDYPRARFREVKARRTITGAYHFCGYVNAPNSFGGMTGWKFFIAAPNMFITEDQASSPTGVLLTACSQNPSRPMTEDTGNWSDALSWPL